MELQHILISEYKTIFEALKKLNDIRNVSRLILFVFNSNSRVIGSLTDGDIRRSLAKDGNIHKEVGHICNKNFVYEKHNQDYINLTPFRKQKIKILPLLNDEGRLASIIDLEKQTSQLPLEAMIMAGGRGKRLSPLTDRIPKPMLPLGGKPIIEHNIDRLISYGIRKLYISVKYLGEQIEEYFGDGSTKGIEIEYVWEKEPLGTAGALALIDNYGTDFILLMNSDLFTNVDIEDLYTEAISSNADMVVASTEYKIDVPYAVFETDKENVTAFREKPSYVYHSNAGIYILKKQLIGNIPKNSFYDITDLMDRLVAEGGKLVHNPIRGFWIDIGKPIDYKQAQEFVKHLKQ